MRKRPGLHIQGRDVARNFMCGEDYAETLIKTTALAQYSSLSFFANSTLTRTDISHHVV